MSQLFRHLNETLVRNVRPRFLHNYTTRRQRLRPSILQNRLWNTNQHIDAFEQKGSLSITSRFVSIYHSRFYSSDFSNKNVPEWGNEFCLKDPEFDWEYLCGADLFEVQSNIDNRKGVGNIETVRKLWQELQADNQPNVELRGRLITAANAIPNTSHSDAPIGGETEAKIVDIVGSKRHFSDFKPKTVTELGENLGLLRTDNVTVSTGTKTYYFKRDLAKLENVLVHYALQHLMKHGFELISVPDILHPSVIEGCGFKTHGERTQVYKLFGGDSHGMCLAGTAEMPLAASFVNEELDRKDLPKKYAAASRCYRAETSSLEEEKGIYRVHQFTKVEMFVVDTNDAMNEGEKLLLELIDIEKDLFQSLGLHFRVLDMPTQELGSPAHRKFDMEAWMPAKGFWGEISSASNCTDFQTRRLNIRYRDAAGALKHATTVNGTACAVPRTVMAILENNQDKNGNITIPSAIAPYFEERQNFSKDQTQLENMSWTRAKKVKKA